MTHFVWELSENVVFFFHF